MALAVTGGGGLVMLAGIVVLGQIAGTYDLSVLMTGGAEIQATRCTRWRWADPGRLLHQERAVAVPLLAARGDGRADAGVGLPALGHHGQGRRVHADAPVPGARRDGLFEGVVASVGLATMVFAAFVAIFKHDLKGLLAYSTVSHLGLITFLIGLGSPMSAVAAVFHVLNHASFKAALFMSAGIVDHETHTRDMRKLGGLFALMPVMGWIVLIGSAAMAGLPPFNGFISKEMMLDEALRAGGRMWGEFGWAVPVLATLGGLFSMAYSVRLVHDTFFNGPPRDLPNPHPHEPPPGMKAPAMGLVVVCIAVGLLPMVIAGPLVAVAASSVLGAPAPEFQLALWHGLNLPLAMSAVAVAGGAAMYFALQRGGWLHRYLPSGRGGKAVFWAGNDGLLGAAGRFTVRLENGSLQRYAAWMVALAIGLAAWALAGSGLGTGGRTPMPATPLALALWLVLLACAAALVLTHHRRFQAVVLTGGVGLVTALTFLGFSAPDLALTQLSVEIVSTVLLLMGLALLPAITPRESTRLRRARDALLAAAGGLGMTWLTWLMLTRDHDSIAWYFLEQSAPVGGGTNAVNVILVDFRGYDTFGEITVLGIAAVGVLALLDRFRVRRPAIDPDGRRWSYAGLPLMLRMAARLVLPLALVVSVYIFWRGHNLPGGGFIAGLVTAVALVLQYMSLGQGRADALLHSGDGQRFTRWVGAGLGIAWLTGVGAFAFGHSFLTSAFGHPIVPVLGELPLATAALFDLGVYVTVVGATMLMLSVLGAASKEGARA
jgi:multicomponent K+:H+ antiporter subunit A